MQGRSPPEKNIQYALRCKMGLCLRFESWLDSICSGGGDVVVPSVIRKVRTRTSLEYNQIWERNMSELNANNYSLVDRLVNPVSLEPVIEKIWQKLD
ncbi:MAG: hypothetical protein ACJ70M_03795 [Nitrososphaera sp.]